MRSLQTAILNRGECQGHKVRRDSWEWFSQERDSEGRTAGQRTTALHRAPHTRQVASYTLSTFMGRVTGEHSKATSSLLYKISNVM